MRLLNALIMATIATTPAMYAQSNLLNSVKRNPNESIALCNKFRAFNEQGISASSEKAIEAVSLQKNLSKIDSEILSMYVIGLHCPEVQ